jgi:long-chain fatty acid transport protein
MRVILARRSAGLIREQRAVFLAIPVAARTLKQTLALLLFAVLPPAAAVAQTPTPTPLPAFARDEKDFEGLTSLALGSGARAFGMGGAFLARADDATAASWNPAGLSYLRRPEVTVVGARNAFDRGFADDFPEEHFEGYTPDFMAATYPIEFGFVAGAVQVSYQRVFSFRGDRVIAGRPLFLSTTEGGFDVLAAGTGLRVFRGLRLGATVNRWFHGYSQSKFRSSRPGRQATKQEIDYRLRGWNINVGLIWSPVESLNVGLVGKSRFTGDLRVRRQRTDYFSELDATQTDTTNEGVGDVRLDFPGAVGVGASWRPRSAMTLSADYTRTFWSQGRIRNFFVLPPKLFEGQTPKPEAQVFGDLLYPTLDDDQQFDTEQIRLGAEYVVIGARVKVPLRAGVFTDRQYFADRNGQAPRFTGFSVGTGLIVGPVLFDVAYVREQGTYPDPEPTGGRITAGFRRVFVSLIYRHGG